MRVCSIPGCGRRHASRDLCAAHLQRLRRTGEIRPDIPIGASTEKRFWAKVEKTDGCWNWTGSTGRHGHGQFGTDKRVVYAHRFAYAQTVGAIPAGHILHHACENPACVNPAHLEAMTQGEHVTLHQRLRFPPAA